MRPQPGDICQQSADSIRFPAIRLLPQADQVAQRLIEEGDRRMSDLKQAIEQVSAVRNDMLKVVKQHRNFLAPMHRLPDDVMLTIVEHMSGRGTGNWESPPWEVSTVCKRWRQLTLSCHYLWTNI
ncbi:hypothetical protein BDV98DRAFT_433958 [Pterulicium gracile]|uniref:F-box domain-containing protein n=1 Tax=Pterulicium gracile TaxID=1884261 RepID=A0A5C3QQ01_9AGAR|nr:hypothetical protein BDV98DRAFT_433958 [Pterula gracilis]